jgi:hypothetical protein
VRRGLAPNGFVLAFLWLALLIMLASLGLWIFVLLTKPDNRLVTAAVLATSGICALLVARLLILWRRARLDGSAERIGA